MRNQRRLTIATALAAFAATLLSLSPWLHAPLVQASPGELFPDSDGDFLPDALEFSTLSDPTNMDSDGDGVGDFMSTVEYLQSNPAPRPAGVQDHEMRILLSGESRSDGTRAIWMHFLFRFAGETLPHFEFFRPYIDFRGQTLPLDQLLSYGRVELKMRRDPNEGLLVHAAVEIGSEADLRAFFRPYEYTIGAQVSIDGKRMNRGVFLKDIQDGSGGNGVFATLVPVSGNQVAFQVLNEGDADNPFWATQRICVMTLELFSSGTGGHTCQIVDASCEPVDGKVSCPPTCPESVGSLVFFPNGLGTITGGG